jgi:iron complex transport system substrate-binding protein
MKNIVVIAVLLISLFFSVAVAGAFQRIVSLAPSMTEILYALGLGDRVVGVTAFCDYPPEAREKPAVGGMSNPSLEAVVSLRPDMVMMTTDGNPKEFQERLRSLGIRTYVFRARRIEELPGALRRMGSALGVRDRAARLASDVEGTLTRLTAAGHEEGGRPIKALFIVWPEPLIMAGPGTAVDDAFRILGVRNMVDSAISYPKYSVEEVIREAPEVIFIGRGHEDMKALSRRLLDRLRGTPAVRDGNVFFVSDGLYRLGPRVPEGIEELSAKLKQVRAGGAR